MAEASIVTTGDATGVRLERRLAEPPRELWRALTDRARLAAWFPCDVVVHGGRWELGAQISFPFPPEQVDVTLRGVVLELDEPRRLSYRWGDEVLRFELVESGDGTVLVVIDELDRSFAARNAAGWEVCLDRLEGLDPAPDAWGAHFSRYARAFEPELGPQQGPPPEYHGDT